MPKSRRKSVFEGAKIEGFCRVQLVAKRNGKRMVEGDSGWMGPNQVVDLGFQDYLVDGLAGAGGAKTISHLMIGTGTEPAAAATALDGELATGTDRKTVSTSIIASKTLQCTAQWASSDSHTSAAITIQNLGLVNTSNSPSTIFSGQTYSTSQWNTDQDLNATYQIRFS